MLIVYIVFLPIFSYTQPFELITTDATCNSNGVIQVKVSGQVGNRYRYSLKSNCGEPIVGQTSEVFTNLVPCTYVVEVTESGKLIWQQIAEIKSTYQDLKLKGRKIGCTLSINVEGGRRPFLYSFGSNFDGVFQPNPDSIFDLSVNKSLYVLVEDACGRSAKFYSGDATFQSIDVTSIYAEEGVKVKLDTIAGKYDLFLINGIDTTTIDPKLPIPWPQITCQSKLRLVQGCLISEEYVNFDPSASIDCYNFSDGTLSFKNIRGIKPIKFTLFTPDTVFVSTTGSFTNLPKNIFYYKITIEDLCHEKDTIADLTRLKPTFTAQRSDCSAPQDISFHVERQCSGTINYPIKVYCLSCSSNTPEIAYYDRTYEFSGLRLGDWRFAIANACGDSTVCKDTLVLELTPACDSIRARVVNRFECDNGTFARRELSINNVKYRLLDQKGRLIAENTTGLFHQIAVGQYQVIAILPHCQDTLIAKTEIKPAIPLHAKFFTSIDHRTINGKCQIRYQLAIEQVKGPYVLRDSSGKKSYEVLNDFGEDNCVYYLSKNLEPGVYYLTSMQGCGTDTITLPQPEFNLDAQVKLVCPNNGQVELLGANKVNWEEWYQQFNLNVKWSQYEPDDDYGAIFPDGKEQGVSDYITGLLPGKYKFLLYAFEGYRCVVDTASLEIPAYQPIQLGVTGNLLCADETTTNLILNINGGQAPFDVNRIDCKNTWNVLERRRDTLQKIEYPNTPLGAYCFVVKDRCVDKDLQVSVNYFQDTIRYHYTCDAKLILEVDSFPLQYRWFDEQNKLIGNTHSITLPLPDQPSLYQLEVTNHKCVIKRRVRVVPRNTESHVSIIPEQDTLRICPGNSVELTYQATAGISKWGGLEEILSKTITKSGVYHLQHENIYGCFARDSIVVIGLENPQFKISGPKSFCADTSILLLVDATFPVIRWYPGDWRAPQLTVKETGIYRALVTDQHGCSAQDSILITKYSLPNPQIIGDTLSCPKGSVRVSVTPTIYSMYQWNTGATTASVDLVKGTHEVIVVDSNGCRNNAEIRVLEREQVKVQLAGDTLVCPNANAQFLPTLVNGTFPLQFKLTGERDTLAVQWNGAAIQVRPTLSTKYAIIQVEMPAYPCPILTEGSFEVVVDKMETKIAIYNDGISCNGSKDGALKSSTTGINQEFYYQWNNGVIGSVVKNLDAGLYQVTTTNGIGCKQLDSFLLQEPELLSNNLNAYPPYCYGIRDGKIIVNNPKGGTAPYQVVWNNASKINTPTEFKNLTPGTYTLHYEDQHGCKTRDTLIYFPEVLPLELNLGADQSILLGDSATIQPRVNFFPKNWKWTITPAPYQLDSLFELTFKPSLSSTLRLGAWNEYNCYVEDGIEVVVDQNLAIYPPNVFSPNEDQTNDRFTLLSKPGLLNNIDLLIIKDRWGNIVYQGNNLTPNEKTQGWDGNVKRQLAQPGVYIWMAELTLFDGNKRQLIGEVTIIR